MIQELRGYINPLLEKGALPFRDKINWKLDLNYDYRGDEDVRDTD